MSEAGAQRPLRVPFAGESWIKRTIHLKGFDQFHTPGYEEGAGEFLAALHREGLAGGRAGGRAGVPRRAVGNDDPGRAVPSARSQGARGGMPTVQEVGEFLVCG